MFKKVALSFAVIGALFIAMPAAMAAPKAQADSIANSTIEAELLMPKLDELSDFVMGSTMSSLSQADQKMVWGMLNAYRATEDALADATMALLKLRSDLGHGVITRAAFDRATAEAHAKLAVYASATTADINTILSFVKHQAE